MIVGSGSISFEIIRYLAEGLPVMFASRWMKTSCQPIAIANVLDYLALALQEPGSVGRILEIGSPDVLSYREMIMGYASVRKQRGAHHGSHVCILQSRHAGHWYFPVLSGQHSRLMVLKRVIV